MLGEKLEIWSARRRVRYYYGLRSARYGRSSYYSLSQHRKKHSKSRWIAKQASAVTFFCLVIVISSTSFGFSRAVRGDEKPYTIVEGKSIVSSSGRTGSTPPFLASSSNDPQKVNQKTNNSTKMNDNSVQTIKNYGKPSWSGMRLYVDPYNSATQYLAANPDMQSDSIITKLSQIPVAQWFGDWNSNVTNDVRIYVTGAAADQSIPVVVLYNIPSRDCGGYSVGGANNVPGYEQWVKNVATGIGSYRAIVVLEPDALGALDCLPDNMQTDRLQSIARAVTILKGLPNVSVYIDAGTPVWQPVDTMASRLKASNVETADGFSLNVSYFATTQLNVEYGNALSAKVGGKHYVIDVSRNGGNNTVTGMQCNPSFASFGELPTTNTSWPLNDALLWIKIPWESDGPCNGSPAPGVPYWSYAKLLATNAGW